MSAFKIYTNKAYDCANSLSDYEKLVRTEQMNLESVQSNLRSKIAAHDQIGAVLKSINEQVLEDAAMLKTLNQALEHILGYYINTEGKIVSENPRLMNGRQGTTSEQQTYMDQYMQAAILTAMEDDRFSQETWENASIEEKKEILKELAYRIEGIMGVSVDGVEFKQGASLNYKGSYNYETNVIAINETYLENADSYSMLATMIHESRHAYQKAACDNPDQFIVSEDTLNDWSENLENYQTHFKNGEYFQMSSEIDAMTFAGQEIDVNARYVPLPVGDEGSTEMYEITMPVLIEELIKFTHRTSSAKSAPPLKTTGDKAISEQSQEYCAEKLDEAWNQWDNELRDMAEGYDQGGSEEMLKRADKKLIKTAIKEEKDSFIGKIPGLGEILDVEEVLRAYIIHK
jgi:hypothetical protein